MFYQLLTLPNVCCNHSRSDPYRFSKIYFLLKLSLHLGHHYLVLITRVKFHQTIDTVREYTKHCGDIRILCKWTDLKPILKIYTMIYTIKYIVSPELHETTIHLINTGAVDVILIKHKDIQLWGTSSNNHHYIPWAQEKLPGFTLSEYLIQQYTYRYWKYNIRKSY